MTRGAANLQTLHPPAPPSRCAHSARLPMLARHASGGPAVSSGGWRRAMFGCRVLAATGSSRQHAWHAPPTRLHGSPTSTPPTACTTLSGRPLAPLSCGWAGMDSMRGPLAALRTAWASPHRCAARHKQCMRAVCAAPAAAQRRAAGWTVTVRMQRAAPAHPSRIRSACSVSTLAHKQCRQR